MGIFHGVADVFRTKFIFENFFGNKAAIDFLKESNIKNKDEILKSRKKEYYIQVYPCWILIIICCIGLFLIVFGRNGNGYMAVPKMIFGVRQDGIGLLTFIISFFTFIIWIIISGIIIHKDLYTSYYLWFTSVDADKLEEIKNKEVIFKDGKMISE